MATAENLVTRRNNRRMLSFEQWMAAVDEYCAKKWGVSVHDLDDIAFCTMYEDGELPSAAARAAYRKTRE
jgi:hypothetical protein